MFDNLNDFFSESASLQFNKDGELTGFEAQVSAIVLLWDTSLCDSFMDEEEFKDLVDRAKDVFGLQSDEIGHLLEVSRYLVQHDTEREQFVDIIKKNFNSQQKTRVLSLAWAVILADREITEVEEAFATSLRDKLSLCEEEGLTARKIAETEYAAWHKN